MARPPLLTEGVKDTDTPPLPALADPIVGAPGTVAGTTLFEAADGNPVPAIFVATTVNVYEVPFAKLPTVKGLVGPVAVSPPGVEVTVNPVIGLPPLLIGAVKLTVAV